MKIQIEFDKASDFAVFVPLLVAVEKGGLLNNPDLVDALGAVQDRLVGGTVTMGGNADPTPVAAASDKKTRAPRGEKSNVQVASAVAGEKITLSAIQVALKTLPDARPKAVAALKKFNVEKISDLKEDQYPAFMVELGLQAGA